MGEETETERMRERKFILNLCVLLALKEWMMPTLLVRVDPLYTVYLFKSLPEMPSKKHQRSCFTSYLGTCLALSS